MARNEKFCKNIRDLQIALKKGDKAQINRLRSVTGVRDDLQTLTAKVRFLEIGMVDTYEESVQLYQREQSLKRQIKDADARLRKEDDKIDEMVRSEMLAYRLGEYDGPGGRREFEQAKRALGESEDRKEQAKKERDYWRDRQWEKK